jgi:[ribosomal protein S18]-alanine N-acetyltransferase
MIAQITLRPLAMGDVEAVAAVEALVYPQPWSRSVFEDELAQANRTYLLAETEGAVAGYGGVMVVGVEAHITTLVVAPERRGLKLGTRIMLGLVEAALSSGATSLTLEVRASNVQAQTIYRRFGMAPVGVRKNYYRTEDALIMWAHDIATPPYRRRLDEIREEL